MILPNGGENKVAYVKADLRLRHLKNQPVQMQLVSDEGAVMPDTAEVRNGMRLELQMDDQVRACSTLHNVLVCGFYTRGSLPQPDRGVLWRVAACPQTSVGFGPHVAPQTEAMGMAARMKSGARAGSSGGASSGQKKPRKSGGGMFACCSAPADGGRRRPPPQAAAGAPGGAPGGGGA